MSDAVPIHRRLPVVVALALAIALLPVVPAHAVPPEDYAPYQPQTTCPQRTTAKPGTRALARWLDRRFGGGSALATKRSCGSGGTSEHKDGRAIDWMMDAGRKADRREVRRFLDRVFATNAAGYTHAKARRMGIMYVIWNDRMWASYDRFQVKPYSVSVTCKREHSCTKTLRHRNHVHISLSRRGGRGLTSWYAGRL